MPAAIASKTNNGIGIMAVISLPLLFPLFVIIIKSSKLALDNVDASVNYKYMGLIFALNILVGALGLLLFPYLWKE